MKLLDLFAGIGGFSHGLTQSGMELMGYCEIDKYAHKAFQILHDPEERLWNAYDVRTIDPFRLPDFDCMSFGWPCQDNSIAGKRKGQLKRDDSNEGNRSGLLFEATNILRIKQPKYFVAENVEGLLSGNDGRDFYATIREFSNVGYDVQWQILNSSAYVPQNRRRIFFVGHLRGTRRPEVFPFGAENSNTIEVVGNLDCYNDQNNRVYGIDGLAPCLPTMQGGGQEPKVMVSAVLTPDREEKRQNGRRFKEPGEPMFTLTAQDKHGVAILDTKNGTYGKVNEYREMSPTLLANDYKEPKLVKRDGEYRIRKLTPLECFRLQSYPDEWYYKLKKAGISDSQLYKQAGNGVTSIVAFEIGKRLAAGHQSTE